VELDGVRLYLFCLMRNHVHLLIETPRGNLSSFMHRVQTAYTVYFNLRHQRVGHLMQGRYGAALVAGDHYLLTLSRYVHLNPVFVGRMRGLPLKERIRRLREYPWSSYRSYIGARKRFEFVDYEPVLALVGGRESRRGLAYRKFVDSGIAETDEEFRVIVAQRGLGIGSEEFCTWVKDRHLDLMAQQKRLEDAAFRREGRWLGEAAILAEVAKNLGLEPGQLEEGWGRGCGAGAPACGGGAGRGPAAGSEDAVQARRQDAAGGGGAVGSEDGRGGVHPTAEIGGGAERGCPSAGAGGGTGGAPSPASTRLGRAGETFSL
jgi:hypothetical protein